MPKISLPLALLLLAPPTVAQDDDSARAIQQSLIAADGLEATLWAASPLCYNPTAIDVDERGRIWVSEAVNYRRFNTKPEDARFHEPGDRIVILEDVDGDGSADQAKVFAQDHDLTAPLGIAVLGNQVVISCAPNLLVYTRDKDDRVVHKEKLLTGFGGFDHDHSLHKAVAGPDGRWYLNVGNAGPHIVTDRSGWTLRAGSSYTGGTPYNLSNTPGLSSDDGRIYTGGVIFRIEPDGTSLRVLGHGCRNPFGTTIDSFGDLWMNDNDDTESCRTTWLMRYGDCGYNSKDGSRSWEADRRPDQSIPTAHWRQDDPGVIPSGHVYGNGGPAGIAYYENGALGERYEGGLVLSCEAGQNLVWAYRRAPSGAGFELSGFPFLSSTGIVDPKYDWSKADADARRWFRPSGVAIGTDGAVYVADWLDPIVGGHAMHDRGAHGAIYRLQRKGARVRAPTYDASSIAGAIELLKSPAINVRYQGYLALRSQGAQAEPALRALLADANRFLRARAVWMLARLGADLAAPLAAADPELRIAALRALEQRADAALLEHAAKLAADPSPAVRREVLLALRDVPLATRLPIVIAIAAQYDGADRWYLEAVGTAAEGGEEALHAALLARLGGPPRSWSVPFAALAWRLHPASAVQAFLERAMTGALSRAQRKQAIDSLAFIKDRTAARAMQEIAGHGPEDLRDYATYWLAHRATNDWKEYGLRTVDRVQDLILPGEPRFESAVLRRGAVDIDLDVSGARHLYLVAKDGGDSISCDWADWLEPRLVRHGAAGEEITARLTDRPWQAAITGWGEVLVGASCNRGKLKVAGRIYADGIGAHATSAIAYDIAGFDRFLARAGVDDGARGKGGAEHESGAASVQFLVYHDGPTAAERAAGQRRVLLDRERSDAEREDAALALARTAEGGRVLVALAMAGQIPEPVRGVIADGIHRNPDLAVRALAGRWFPRTSDAGARYPPIDDLLALAGDAGAGRQVFLGSRAACTSCHRIGTDGRDIGPELSRIGDKYDRRTLLDAILNPSAAILTGYETQLIELDDGESLTGFIIGDDGDTVTLKDTAGVRRTLAKQTIHSRQQLELSVMPDNIALGLEPQELADLVAYLQSLRSVPR
ncbi:MAG: PVC-type heme-binding CxxCH protein [Planctomycetota bacterium]